MTKKDASELRKEFPYLTINRIQSIAKSSHYKTMRGIKNAMRRANDEFAELDNVDSDHEVERVEIQLEWKDNRTWGWCPRATADIKYKNGKWSRETAYASGCGYDKASTVVADVLNKCLRYKL
jgi:hypothetical protein